MRHLTLAGRLALVAVVLGPQTLAAQESPDLGAALRVYEAFGRNVELTAPVDQVLQTDPNVWAGSNGLSYEGVLQGGVIIDAAPSAGQVLVFRDPVRQEFRFAMDGRPFRVLPPLSIDAPTGFGFENFPGPGALFSGLRDSDLDNLIARLQVPEGLQAEARPPRIQWVPVLDRGASLAEIEASFQLLFDAAAIGDQRIWGGGLGVAPLNAPNTGEEFPHPSLYSTGSAAQGAILLRGDGAGLPIVEIVEALPPSTIDPGMAGMEYDAGLPKVVCIDPENAAAGRGPVGPVACFLGTVALHLNHRGNDQPVCSGVVISPRHILAAAHCLFFADEHVQQRYWVHDPVFDAPHVTGTRGLVQLVARFGHSQAEDVPWEDPDGPTFFDRPDLALFELLPGASFHRIRVPMMDMGDIVDRPLRALGYGENPDPAITGYKQIVTLAEVTSSCPAGPLATPRACRPAFEFTSSALEPTGWLAFYHTERVSLRSNIANAADGDGEATDEPLPPDTCGGDSGGPVFVATASGWALAGLTSRAMHPRETRGESSCDGQGGIYTRVGTAEVVDWIATVLAADGCMRVEAEGSVLFPECDPR